MSEDVKPCGAYVSPRVAGSWLAAAKGCQRPGTGETGMCRHHEAGRKRSATARKEFEARYNAEKEEDARRKAAFRRFIAEMDASGLAVYAEVRQHLRMQMAGGHLMWPEETK